MDFLQLLKLIKHEIRNSYALPSKNLWQLILSSKQGLSMRAQYIAQIIISVEMESDDKLY